MTHIEYDQKVHYGDVLPPGVWLVILAEGAVPIKADNAKEAVSNRWSLLIESAKTKWVGSEVTVIGREAGSPFKLGVWRFRINQASVQFEEIV